MHFARANPGALNVAPLARMRRCSKQVYALVEQRRFASLEDGNNHPADPDTTYAPWLGDILIVR
jgi:hypothetical protein